MYANKSWTRLTDYQQHEIEGKDLCFMQGALTDSVSLKHVSELFLRNATIYYSSSDIML